MSWAAEEFATVDLGDKRLNKRLVKVVQQWADKPSQSIPTASGGWGDTAAAYRMLDNYMMQELRSPAIRMAFA